jgi:hypothetical protein
LEKRAFSFVYREELNHGICIKSMLSMIYIKIVSFHLSSNPGSAQAAEWVLKKY